MIDWNPERFFKVNITSRSGRCGYGRPRPVAGDPSACRHLKKCLKLEKSAGNADLALSAVIEALRRFGLSPPAFPLFLDSNRSLSSAIDGAGRRVNSSFSSLPAEKILFHSHKKH